MLRTFQKKHSIVIASDANDTADNYSIIFIQRV
ncbi:Uncharacterised protein [Serratia quinivorans]|uniref:Uncharacterized protein n=1 Tax=Serratia quinivorans TaxID=137545 RepID=A0A380AL42_9GAMM|nr:Uncharacterised protein [Serratia quinivorans]